MHIMTPLSIKEVAYQQSIQLSIKNRYIVAIVKLLLLKGY